MEHDCITWCSKLAGIKTVYKVAPRTHLNRFCPLHGFLLIAGKEFSQVNFVLKDIFKPSRNEIRLHAIQLPRIHADWRNVRVALLCVAFARWALVLSRASLLCQLAPLVPTQLIGTKMKSYCCQHFSLPASPSPFEGFYLIWDPNVHACTCVQTNPPLV